MIILKCPKCNSQELVEDGVVEYFVNGEFIKYHNLLCYKCNYVVFLDAYIKYDVE